ncbi:3-methyladenine DNA glycosylase [Prochlorococcus marinus XMU1408]|uniref:Putative 3-methyladenine DNA glycosylase n=1 Tax=Prochlorococcus marinus XMU1408 TaxID=2213228 RepID=A0A318R8K8_PROMR|nr:3-methyladenine DNA glycosylase [Prochlorococcus marinus str. XMU1408]PYE02469.1 3-methyladenine DNA glycosylase [Prochlorococcus marinus XMU1408]
MAILTKEFFSRPSHLVAPDLIGCYLNKRVSKNKNLSGVIVETEAYSQEEDSCHGFSGKTKRNETLFGEPGNLYIYISYGIYHCVNVVTGKKNWANGVLLRSIAIRDEDERIAAGPGLLAKRFGLNRKHDNLLLSPENNFWFTNRKDFKKMGNIVQTTRIGISKAKDIPWRWYLESSRSVSKRVKGDKIPPTNKCWYPSSHEGL